MVKWFITVFVLLLAYSCIWDNEETLFPVIDQECDTIGITFTSDITPILESHCYSCHSNVNAPSFGNNISLEEYDDVSSLSSIILGAIKHEQGVQPMPRSGAQLNDCLIMKFEAWTNNGTPEN